MKTDLGPDYCFDSSPTEGPSEARREALKTAFERHKQRTILSLEGPTRPPVGQQRASQGLAYRMYGEILYKKGDDGTYYPMDDDDWVEYSRSGLHSIEDSPPWTDSY